MFHLQKQLNMKKNFLFLILTIVFSGAFAQLPVFKIHGRITYQETGAPVAGQPVVIAMDSPQNTGHLNKVITDANGEYTDTLLYSPEIDQSKILVSTFDCRGANVIGTGYVRPGKLEEVVNLSICGKTDTKCEAIFKFSPNPANPLGIAFYDGSRYLPGSGKVNYAWDFGDGSSSTDQNPVHTYASDGVYNVCLNISSADSLCNSSFCMPVKTGSQIPQPCSANFLWYSNDSSAATILFEVLPDQNSAGSYKWDFGDGTTASGPKVAHTFQSANTSFKVCLSGTWINADGTTCKSYECQEVYVYKPSPCENSFYYQADSTGLGFTFEGWTKDNAVTDWQWDFGDGTSAKGQKVWHIFTGKDSYYKVCLTTQSFTADGTSCLSTSCQEIFITVPSACSNHFEITSADNLTFTFTGKVDAADQAAEYYWDFGDGESAKGQQVTHTFRGTKAELYYNVCLTTLAKTTDSLGNSECKSISCQFVFPGNNMQCQAAMSAIPDSSGFNFRFENLSKGNPSFVSWDFGDGIQSNEPNPVHTYTKPGIYTACLFVSDTLNNCWDNTCQEIWVNMIQNGCKASFNAYQAENAAGITYSFMNTSSPGYSNQFWTFGDGSVSYEQNPVHTFAAPGKYNVCLTVWNTADSCKDVFCMDVFYGQNTGYNRVPGTVIAGNSPAEKSMVWLISADNSYYDQAITDTAGNFYFKNVPDGSYYLYAMLTPGSADFFKYMPTYFPNSLTWFNAETIRSEYLNSWYMIQLVPSVYAPEKQGPATISGFINWEGRIKSPGSIPASNVEVVLFNQAGDPVAYAFTDSNGYFEFKNLQYGNYSIHAEMTGKSTATADINLTENESKVNINFAMNDEAIIAMGIDKSKNPAIVAGNPYPNPVVDILNIQVNHSVSKAAEIEIIDMQGRVIQAVKPFVVNNSLLQVETGNLSKGIYMLRIKAPGYQDVVRRFIK